MNTQVGTTAERATIRERFALRMIGVGLLLLTPDRVRNLVRYFGSYRNLGVWLMNTRIADSGRGEIDQLPLEVERE